MAEENEDQTDDAESDDNQYGGSEQDIDAVEQTERMTDDEQQSTEDEDE